MLLHQIVDVESAVYLGTSRGAEIYFNVKQIKLIESITRAFEIS